MRRSRNMRFMSVGSIAAPEYVASIKPPHLGQLYKTSVIA